MKKHKVLLKQMKQLNKLMKKVRKQKIASLPNQRPIWLPHYFWHWLHHFPHFHQLHLGKKVPWISSAARIINKQNNYKFDALLGIDNMYNNYDDQVYNQLINAVTMYINADNDYNNNYDNDVQYLDNIADNILYGNDYYVH
eukprot:102772_1